MPRARKELGSRVGGCAASRAALLESRARSPDAMDEGLRPDLAATRSHLRLRARPHGPARTRVWRSRDLGVGWGSLARSSSRDDSRVRPDRVRRGSCENAALFIQREDLGMGWGRLGAKVTCKRSGSRRCNVGFRFWARSRCLCSASLEWRDMGVGWKRLDLADAGHFTKRVPNDHGVRLGPEPYRAVRKERERFRSVDMGVGRRELATTQFRRTILWSVRICNGLCCGAAAHTSVWWVRLRDHC